MTLKHLLENKKFRDIVRQSWSVSWPMAMIMLFIFLIGLADVYVAGRFGKEVQAAYGVAFQIYFILTIPANALSVGVVSLISRLFTSQEDKERFYSIAESSIIAACVTGFVLGLLGAFFSKGIVNILSIPSALKSDTAWLLAIYSSGLAFHYLLLNTNAILRASKMARASLWTMFVVCVLNLALNFYLALGTPLGFKGIAVATVISMFCGMLMNAIFLRQIIIKRIKFSFLAIRKILDISWPAAFLQIFWQLAAMALFLILSKLPVYAIETIAAFTNGLKIESVIFLPAFAFNMANAAVVGNLLGAKEREDAFSAGIITALIGVLIVTLLTILVMLNAHLIAAKLSDNGIVIKESIKYIYISLIFEPLMAWGVILSGALNGAGDTKSVMVIIALSVWLVRVPLSYFLAIYLGLGAVFVWWAMNASILTQSIFITRRYFSRRWISQG